MADYDFPTSPSAGATHTIGDKTWEYNGAAWEKIFSGDGVQNIGISGGAVASGRSGLLFDSKTTGATLSLVTVGNTASVIFEADALASNQGDVKYNYGVTSGVLNVPNAQSDGDLIYNDTSGLMSIYKFGLGSTDNRGMLAAVPGTEATGRVVLIFGSGENFQEKYFQFDAADSSTNYDATNLDLLIHNVVGGTAGNGKIVGIRVEYGDNIIGPKRAFRLPGGATFDTVVNSFNGATGHVTTTSTVLPVAGISASGGATFGGIIHVPGLTLGPGGVTFPDGTNMKTAAAGGGGIEELNGSTAAGITLAQGFRYKVSAVAASPSSPSAGEIAIKDFLGAGVVPSGFKLHKNPRNSVIDLSFNSGNDESYFKRFADSGGILTITNEKTGKSAQFIDTANFTSSSNILEYSANAKSYDATSALASVGDFVIVQLDFYTDAGVTSIGGTAFQNKGALSLGKGITAENAGGGTGRLRLEQETMGFIIDAAYFGGGMNANTGYLASMFGELGYFGLFLGSFIVGLLVFFLNILKKKNFLIAYLLSINIAFILINSPLIDMFLSSGIIFVLLITIILKKPDNIFAIQHSKNISNKKILELSNKIILK